LTAEEAPVHLSIRAMSEERKERSIDLHGREKERKKPGITIEKQEEGRLIEQVRGGPGRS